MLNVVILVIATCLAGVGWAAPMGTAFTYQGRLVDANSPAEGLYDFEFAVFNALDGGSQQGSTVDVNDVDVTDGYFTLGLDFGAGIFTGDARWLEIAVRPGASSDPCDFATLTPRQEVTPAPYALQTRGIFVDDAGNVGIGTTSPIAKLDVSGNMNANTSSSSPAITGTNSGTGQGVYGEAASTSETGVYGRNTTSGNWGCLGGPNTGAFGRNNNNGNMGWLGGSDEAVRGDSFSGYGVYGSSTNRAIYGLAFNNYGYNGYSGYFENGNVYVGGGSVGIRTMTPAYELDVSGSIRATGTIYGNVDNADKLDGQHGSYYQDWNNLTNIPAGFADGIDNVGAGLTLPYAGSTSSSGTAFSISNTGSGWGIYGSSATGFGVYGRETSSGNYGYLGSGGAGVYGRNGSSGNYGQLADGTRGVYGYGNNGDGVYGYSPSAGYGVHGASGSSYGVYGRNTSSGNYGYLGGSNYAGYFNGDVKVSGTGKGIVFPDGTKQTTAASGGGLTLPYSGSTSSSSTAFSVTNSGTGNGIFADIANTSTASYAIKGRAPGRGIFGHATATSGLAYGVYGLSNSINGIGVHAESPQVGIHAKATSTTATNYGGYFETSSEWGYGVLATAPSFGVLGSATSTSGSNNWGGTFWATSGNGVNASGSQYDFYANGPGTDYGSSSSIRWKNNVRLIDSSLDKVMALRGVFFNWDEDHGGHHDVGMVAEEVGEVLPEIVQYEESGEYATGMDYSKLTPLLVEAIKELKAEKDAEIAALKERLATMEAAIGRLINSNEGGQL